MQVGPSERLKSDLLTAPVALFKPLLVKGGSQGNASKKLMPQVMSLSMRCSWLWAAAVLVAGGACRRQRLGQSAKNDASSNVIVNALSVVTYDAPQRLSAAC